MLFIYHKMPVECPEKMGFARWYLAKIRNTIALVTAYLISISQFVYQRLQVFLILSPGLGTALVHFFSHLNIT